VVSKLRLWLGALFLFGWALLQAAGEELPELESDALQDAWLRQFYAELAEGGYKLKLNSRSRISEDDWNFLWGIKLSDNQLTLNANLNTETPNRFTGNFTLSRRTPKSTLKELQIGSYRVQWGSGLIFSRALDPVELGRFLPAPHPQSYSPLGAAARIGYSRFSAFALASWQNRSVSLTDGRISYLYKSKAVKLSQAAEAIVSGGAEYQSGGLALGTLLYCQNFDREFANPNYAQTLTAASFAAGYKGRAFAVQTEAASLNGKAALKAQAELNLPGIRQSLGFSSRQGIQLPVYAARPTLLSAVGKGYEVDWDLALAMRGGYKLGLRQAVFNNAQTLQSPHWLSRNTLYLQTDPKGIDILLQFTRLDREIISSQDSSYADTRPVHYRVLFKMQHQVVPNVSFHMQFRYHREDRSSVKNDGIYWENAFVFKPGKLRVETGLKSWQSSRSLVFEDTCSENPSGSSLATGDEFAWFITPGFAWKALRIKAELQQSLHSGNTTFYLGLGI